MRGGFREVSVSEARKTGGRLILRRFLLLSALPSDLGILLARLLELVPAGHMEHVLRSFNRVVGQFATRSVTDGARSKFRRLGMPPTSSISSRAARVRLG